MKTSIKLMTAAVLISISGIGLFSNCQGCSRDIKNISSEINGLNRRITLMNCVGDTIKTWEGRYLINSDSANGYYFDDENGKRITVHGGITITEEL